MPLGKENIHSVHSSWPVPDPRPLDTGTVNRYQLKFKNKNTFSAIFVREVGSARSLQYRVRRERGSLYV